MRKVMILIGLLFLMSCWLTNQEIVEQIKYCKEQWFIYRVSTNWFWDTTKITCKENVKELEINKDLSEIDKIQIKSCLDKWLHPRQSGYDWEYYCE